MIIEAVNIKNFRSILDETLQCENLTVLVGANGAGKSSFLRGLELFYSAVPKITTEDFYNEDTAKEIVIAVTFNNLSDEAKNLFSSYIQGETLTVERMFMLENEKISWKYHGASLQNPLFQSVRDAMTIKDKSKSAKEAYAKIRSMADYAALPAWSNVNEVQQNLKQWETANTGKCHRQRDDGQFFGFKEVGQGHLGKFTRFLFIPAVRNVSDDTIEGKGSILTELMDLVVRSVLANKEALVKLKDETQKQYKEIMDPNKLTEITMLSDDLTKTLKTFVPDAKVNLDWLPLSDVNIPMPQAIVKLVEDGYSSSVNRTGHGLQRAFILTMLQHLALAQTKSANSGEPSGHGAKLPDLVIAIEEPELYQHPSRQRHLSSVLLCLAAGKTPGVAEKTQIIYATHSPLFVGIDRVNHIRLLRKYSALDSQPKITKVIRTDLDRVANAVWEADGKPGTQYTGASLIPRLQSIMTPWMNEGFFSDVVVLVEGEDDRAAILGSAKAMGYDLESSGFSIIPCGGKTNLDRPATIFNQLDIPTYIIWDSDKGEKGSDAKHNHRLLRLMQHPISDWPAKVDKKFACFEIKLETTLCNEIGKDEFEKCLSKCQNELCITKREHAIKNPTVIANVIQKSQEKGLISTTLKQITEKIIALKQ